MHLFRRQMLPVGIILLLLLGGCGYNGRSGAPTPATSPSVPPTDSVVLQVGAASYRAGETIRVTIINHSAQTISFTDHKTSCTVLLFEHQVGSSWESVVPCKLMIMTRLLSLKAGATLDVKLVPSLQLPAGTYLAQLDYSELESRPNLSIGTPKTVSSSEVRLAVGAQSHERGRA